MGGCQLRLSNKLADQGGATIATGPVGKFKHGVQIYLESVRFATLDESFPN